MSTNRHILDDIPHADSKTPELDVLVIKTLKCMARVITESRGDAVMLDRDRLYDTLPVLRTMSSQNSILAAMDKLKLTSLWLFAIDCGDQPRTFLREVVKHVKEALSTKGYHFEAKLMIEEEYPDGRPPRVFPVGFMGYVYAESEHNRVKDSWELSGMPSMGYRLEDITKND